MSDEELAKVQRKVAELTERNEHLVETLRDARNQMVTISDAFADADRVNAVGEALCYAVAAIDVKINSLRRHTTQGTVGSDLDRTQPDAYLAEVFEAGLRRYGFQIVPVERPTDPTT